MEDASGTPLIGSILHESDSQRNGVLIYRAERTINLKTTEVIAQPTASGASTATVYTYAQEKRRLFIWGEEVVESSSYLVNTAAGASSPLTTYTTWYEPATSDPDKDPSYARIKLITSPGGQWQGFFYGTPDPATPAVSNRAAGLFSGTVSGWKNTPAPATTTTGAYLNGLLYSSGYAGVLTGKRPGERRAYRESTFENAAEVTRTEDLTTDLSRIVLEKKYANASTFFVTLTQMPATMHGTTNVLRFKENQVPALPYGDPQDNSKLISHQQSTSNSNFKSRTTKEILRTPAIRTETFLTDSGSDQLTTTTKYIDSFSDILEEEVS